MNILGIETSCDETAAAIVNDRKEVLAQALISQASHAEFGGVVPELASREHLQHLAPMIEQVMGESGLAWRDIDAIAVTAGPGLIGGVVVGVMMAKTLAAAHDKPLIGVNHLEGHALTVRLTGEVAFPYLLLLVSGGHCMLLEVRGVGDYSLYGQTLDDAVGECFDKVAKMLELGYPGGPKVEALARDGDAMAYDFPKPLCGKAGMNFSFSGLKTAVRQVIERLGGDVSDVAKANICASFQRAAGACLRNRAEHAMQAFIANHGTGHALVVAGGVAANGHVREELTAAAQVHDMVLHAPPLALCTDNAAMIAWAGLERFVLGQCDDLTLTPKARWGLA